MGGTHCQGNGLGARPGPAGATDEHEWAARWRYGPPVAGRLYVVGEVLVHGDSSTQVCLGWSLLAGPGDASTTHVSHSAVVGAGVADSMKGQAMTLRCEKALKLEPLRSLDSEGALAKRVSYASCACFGKDLTANWLIACYYPASRSWYERHLRSCKTPVRLLPYSVVLYNRLSCTKAAAVYMRGAGDRT